MADTLFDISDRVIWVTGSSRGVGRGVAEHLAAHGAAVVVYARRPEALEEVMAALHALGAPALAVTADVRDEASVADAVAAIDTRFARGHRKRGRRSVRSGGIARARQVPKAARPESHRRLHHGQVGLSAAACEPRRRGADIRHGRDQTHAPVRRLWCAQGRDRAPHPLAGGRVGSRGARELRLPRADPNRGFAEVGVRRQRGPGRASRTDDRGRADRRAARYSPSLPIPAQRRCGLVSGAVLLVDGGPTEGPTQRIHRALEDD